MARYFKESNFKKSYIPVILTSIMLVLLVCGLGYVIFFMKDGSKKQKKLYIDSLGDYELPIKIASFADNEVVDFNYDINTKTETNVKVKNYVINDFINKNIMLSNSKSFFVKDDLLIYSNSQNKEPYISLITLKGETKWYLNLKNSDYPNLTINSVNLKDDKLYVIYTNNNQILGQIISTNGKTEQIKSIAKLDAFSYFGSVLNNDEFIFYTIKSGFVLFYKCDLKFKLTNGKKNLYDYKNDYVAREMYPVDIVSYNNKVYMGLIMYTNAGEKHLIINIDYDKDKIIVNEIKDGVSDTNMYQMFNNKFYTYDLYGVSSTDIESNTTINNTYAWINDNYDDEAEEFLFSPKKIYFDGKNEFYFTSNEVEAIIDVLESNKLKQRINMNLYNNKIEGLPLNIKKKDNKLYIVYLVGTDSLYINEYDMKE